MRRPETYRARQLRRAMSLPEVLLWKQLKGIHPKFRRQHPIGPYVIDFYCAAARLIIEIDGFAHDMGDRAARDAVRTGYLHEKGYTVLRIPASAVLQDAAAVAQSMVLAAGSLPVTGEES